MTIKNPNACNAVLYIADDYGDNEATITCQLDPGHAGDHVERFDRRGNVVTITWTLNEDNRY